MEFTITANNGDSVKIAAQNWMLAMGKALPFFCLDLGDVGSVTCRPGEDGAVFVECADADGTWMIREVAPAITVVAAASSPVMEDEPSQDEEAAAAPAPKPVAAPPAFNMPIRSSLKPVAVRPDDADEDEDDEVESLAERLFDLSMDLSMAGPDEACKMALDLVLDFVPVEAASVARGSINDPCLTYVAASGPVADQVQGRKVPFGSGLVGLAFDIAGTLQVKDASADSRHDADFDNATGFQTRGSLCVPVLTSDGRAFGVIQLLNPPGASFDTEQVDIVETVARTLATALSAHLG